MRFKRENHKVVYILPEYDSATDTHYAYLYSFIERVAEDLDLFVVVEKGNQTPMFSGVQNVVVKRRHSKIGRMLEGVFLLKRVRKMGYRDFYVHYSFVGALSALLVTKLFGGRVFYWNCGMPWLYRRGFFREFVFRYILRNSILVTGAESLRDEYVKRYGLSSTKTRVVPNWTSLAGVSRTEKSVARKTLHVDQNAKVVLFVHHLSKRKGADMIVPVARMLPDMTFVVVGDGPDRAKLELASRVQKNVVVVGKVAHKDIGVYFSVADVFFMPSEEEGFPHVILESMAYGVPYIASDVGAVREISPNVEHEYLIKDRNAGLFAEAIKKMLMDMPKASGLKTHVEKYNANMAVGLFLELFE